MARLTGIRHFFSEVSHTKEKEDASCLRRARKLEDSSEMLSREQSKIVCEGDQSRALQEIPQLNYAIKYVTTHLQEIPQRIR